MLKPYTILLILALICSIQGQSIGVAPCPRQYQLGSVITTRITTSQTKGIIQLKRNVDVQCYNYSLPYAFARVPQVAIAIHDFDAAKTDDLFFSIKPIRSQSLSYLPLLVRTHWKYTNWRKISFSILAEDRADLESGYYQVDSGTLGGCQPGKNIHVLLPFRSLTIQGNINHNIFLNGFQISSQFYSSDQNSPLQIQVIDAKTNSSGISLFFTTTTITQVHAVHLSYIAWDVTALSLVSGRYASDITNTIQISHIPQSNVGRNYARIFGITGFVINQNHQDIFFATIWTGSKFNFDLDASTPFIQYLSFEYLFFLGSQCSDCPGYPLIFNNTCRQYCPDGYYATSEKVCINCGQGHYWNGTACVKECLQGQFLNIATNECQCPIGLHFNGVTCISCFGGKIFNKEKNKCECPQDTRWNGYGCSTIDVCQDGKVWNVFSYLCQCPLNTFYNGTQCVRIVTCSNGKISDGRDGCICPPGTYLIDNYCTPTNCQGGQIWDGTKCVCQMGYNFNGSLCLLCINGQQWNSQQLRCDCPVQYTWNGNYCEKQINCTGNRIYNATVQQCLCPANNFWNGFSCMVKPECCCGKVWNQTSFQCDCPSSFNYDGTNCVLCINGKTWDQGIKRCVCRQGTQWNGHFCVVIQNCYGGTIWNQNTYSCQCPAVTVWNGRYCVANPCMGRVWDAAKRQCICPQGLQFINSSCRIPIQQTCIEPRIFDSNASKCVCPQGFFDNTVNCVPIPTCQGGQIINPNTNKCQCQYGLILISNLCRDPTCPENKRWDGFGCVQVACPPNSYYNGTQCICPDPEDYCQPWEYYDGTKCVYQPGQCPQGTTWNGTFCIPDNSCPAGFYTVGSQCAPLPQRCIPPTTYANGRCQIRNGCPHGSYYRNGNCMPYIPCQQGQVWSNDMVNCVCPEGTQWNGDKCLACTGGKTWVPFQGCECSTGYFFTGTRCQKFDQQKCSFVPNAFWDGQQCVCHDGFHVQGIQCQCDGVKVGDRCDRCAHRPNSEWRYGQCRCKDGYTLFRTECLGNQVGHDQPQDCNVGTFYDNQQRRCLPCPAGCLSCESSYKCIQCRPQFNFDATSELCSEHCGDGLRFVYECDDGNNVPGDGCSSDCKIEQGYICRGGSPNSADVCQQYLPQQVTITQTGQIRYKTKIVVNVNVDYLPKNLLQSTDCNDKCSNVLDGKIISGDKDVVSIRATYIVGTSYTFSMEINFGRSYIGKFTIQIMVNQAIADHYFIGVDTSRSLIVQVDPSLLSKVNDDYLG